MNDKWRSPSEKPEIGTEVQMYLKDVQEVSVGAYTEEGFIGLAAFIYEHDSDGGSRAYINNLDDVVLLWKPISDKPTEEELSCL